MNGGGASPRVGLEAPPASLLGDALPVSWIGAGVRWAAVTSPRKGVGSMPIQPNIIRYVSGFKN